MPGRRRLTFGEARKHALHRIDAGEIAMEIVIATPLTGKQPKTPPRIVLARPSAAQVDQGSQVLLLLERSGRDAAVLQACSLRGDPGRRK